MIGLDSRLTYAARSAILDGQNYAYLLGVKACLDGYLSPVLLPRVGAKLSR